MVGSLESVFNPRSVAVIGASEVPGKAAERRTRSLFEGGYDGDVYLVNPKRSKLFGRKAYPSITAFTIISFCLFDSINWCITWVGLFILIKN